MFLLQIYINTVKSFCKRSVTKSYFFSSTLIYYYWPSVRPRWLDMGQVHAKTWQCETMVALRTFFKKTTLLFWMRHDPYFPNLKKKDWKIACEARSSYYLKHHQSSMLYTRIRSIYTVSYNKNNNNNNNNSAFLGKARILRKLLESWRRRNDTKDLRPLAMARSFGVIMSA